MNDVFFTGDIHGRHSIMKLSSDSFPEGLELTKDDYVVILGDFGVLWANSPDSEERYLINWLNKKPWTTLVVPGNHENYTRINKLPQVDKFGAKIKKVSDSIFIFNNGECYTIGDKKLFSFGGGTSIDKADRTPYKTWWPEEVPSFDDIVKARETIKNIKEADVVVSHAIFKSAFDHIFEEGSLKKDDELHFILEEFHHTLKYKMWYCGHYHIDYFYNEANVRFMYHDIVKG